MGEGLGGFLRLEKGRVEGYQESQAIPLGTDVTVLGRPPIRSGGLDAEIPDIKINDDHVSRGHARIYFSYDEARFVVQERDTGTQNGTYINGERIEPGRAYALKDGDVLALAKADDDYRVILRFRQQEGTLPAFAAVKETPTGELAIDLRARRVWVSGEEVPLRRKEFDLLAYLYENRGRACSKDEVAQTVWADESGIVSQETIDQNIHRIRERIEPDPSNPSYIVTLPRYGYRLDL